MKLFRTSLSPKSDNFLSFPHQNTSSVIGGVDYFPRLFFFLKPWKCQACYFRVILNSAGVLTEQQEQRCSNINHPAWLSTGSCWKCTTPQCCLLASLSPGLPGRLANTPFQNIWPISGKNLASMNLDRQSKTRMVPEFMWTNIGNERRWKGNSVAGEIYTLRVTAHRCANAWQKLNPQES